MADFILYSYQCHPEHTEIDPQKSLLTDFEVQENKRADENMARHQELFQAFFSGEDAVSAVHYLPRYRRYPQKQFRTKEPPLA